MDTDPISLASAFFMHIGARNLQLEFTQGQKQLLAHPITKYVTLFAMFYVSTRHFVWSAILLGVYFLTINMLLNEKHPWNVMSRRWLQANGLLPKEKETKGSVQLYYENLQKLS